jgi:hypothetical protein
MREAGRKGNSPEQKSIQFKILRLNRVTLPVKAPEVHRQRRD